MACHKFKNVKKRCGQVSELGSRFYTGVNIGVVKSLLEYFIVAHSVQHHLFDTFYFHMSMHKELDVCRLGFSSLVH